MASKEVTPTPRQRHSGLRSSGLRSPVPKALSSLVTVPKALPSPVSRAEGTLVTRHLSLVTVPKALPSPAPQRPAKKVSLGKNVPYFKPISENQ
ncbi:MAG: hypothetical protein J7D60_09070 [Prosthecochloris sp.]|nr:hypothetical protein [Prosthecochloris sp.]